MIKKRAEPGPQQAHDAGSFFPQHLREARDQRQHDIFSEAQYLA